VKDLKQWISNNAIFSSVYENLLTSDLTLDPPELNPGSIYDLEDQDYYVFFHRATKTNTRIPLRIVGVLKILIHFKILD